MLRHGFLAATALAVLSVGVIAGLPLSESPHSSAASAARSSVSSKARSSAKHVASSLAKSSAAPKPVVPPQNKYIPVLVYHHVRDTKPYPKSTWSWKMSVTRSVFEKQLQWIADHGYTTIDLNTYVSIMKGEIQGPEKPIVITFDDNNITQYDIALPLLEKHKFVAVFYLVTNRLGQKSGVVINNELALDMHRRGQDIESHTVTHRALTGLGPAQITQELADSKKALETLLGKSVLHVAYPGTAHNKTVRELAKAAGYVTGTVMDPRTATEKDDFFKVPRIMMTDDTNLAKTLP